MRSSLGRWKRFQPTLHQASRKGEIATNDLPPGAARDPASTGSYVFSIVKEGILLVHLHRTNGVAHWRVAVVLVTVCTFAVAVSAALASTAKTHATTITALLTA